MIDCDWCGAPMHWIGWVETGMLRGHAMVWLCTREGCGHESEVSNGRLPLSWWREQLLLTMQSRCCGPWWVWQGYQ